MSFNFEDKVTWDELAPSLQAKFKKLQDKIKTDTTLAKYRLADNRITISRYSPQNPINNKDLWIDEKYRIARVFTENYWEFTRCGWASSNLSPANDPNQSDDDIHIDVPEYKPTVHKTNFAKFTQTSAYSSFVPNPKISYVDSEGYTINAYGFMGRPNRVVFTVDVSKCTNGLSDVLCYIFWKCSPDNNFDEAAASRKVFKVTRTNLVLQATHVGNGKYEYSINNNQEGSVMNSEIESKLNGLDAIRPGESNEHGFIKFDPSVYKFPYPNRTGVGWAHPRYQEDIGEGYKDQGGSKPRPDCVHIKGTLSISIDVEDTY